MGSTASSPKTDPPADVIPSSIPGQMQATNSPDDLSSNSRGKSEEVGSYCQSYGKDKVIFLSKEDWEKPVRDLPETLLQSLDEEEGPRGVILPNGDINWACPCLGNLSYGPCGVAFREAFSCFHYSAAEMKGSDCIDQFHRMTQCMAKYPTLYPQDDDEDEGDAEEEGPFATIDKAEQQASQQNHENPPKVSSAKKNPHLQ